MAIQSRRKNLTLEQFLLQEPFRFSFFQAVRLLERLGGRGEPVGRDTRPGHEAVRFVARLGLGFPASEIHDVRPAVADRDLAPSGTPTMTIAFMGLTGPMGVLPTFYTEKLIEEFLRCQRVKRDSIPPLAAFLDLFNHRLASLFYRAWDKYHPFSAWDPRAREPLDRAVCSLAGLRLPATRERASLAADAFLFYAGLFASNRRHAAGLEDLLKGCLGEPIELVQFVGRWLSLGRDDRSRLGAGGANNQLRVNLTLGSRIWDEQGKFRLRVGPLSYHRYTEFLPGRPAFEALVRAARLYIGPEYEFDVQLVLKAAEVPRCRLGAAPAAASLHRTSWLLGRAPARDIDNMIFPSSNSSESPHH
jgi:type VI secretion system protein ImpH